MYWGGFDTTWKLAVAMLLGLVLFAIGAARASTGAQRTVSNAIWMAPWLGGHVVIGAIGRYGGGRNLLPTGSTRRRDRVLAGDLLLGRRSLTPERAAAEVAKDAHQLT